MNVKMSESKENKFYLSGVMGVVTGDALGCPVQFLTREEVAENPVTGMRGYGTFNLPEGSWTDDSSLTLALLASLKKCGAAVPSDIMENFMAWMYDGAFTPYGYSYDIGQGTMDAIDRYRQIKDATRCGGRDAHNNGNGSLMRILPVCIFCAEKLRAGEMSEEEAVRTVRAVGSLTHAHIRANLACGLYFFMTFEMMYGEGSLAERLQRGCGRGFSYYEAHLTDQQELGYYRRLRDLEALSRTPAAEIRSGGYVVESLEAAVWSLLTAETFPGALLAAVNLGGDTDSIAAIAGGLAGLYYGYEAIPKEWLAVIKRREWIEALCGE